MAKVPATKQTTHRKIKVQTEETKKVIKSKHSSTE